MKALLKISIAIFLFLPVFVSAKSEIIINEIAWMGKKDSYSKEWIEIYNTTDKQILLNNWILRISKTNIPLVGSINPNSYYLLERNSDNTVEGQFSDLIFKKALNNKGEIIALTDDTGQEIDMVDCSSGWFAGNNKTKQTMERIAFSNDGNNKDNWQTSKEENGTPKGENDKKIEKATTKQIAGDTAIELKNKSETSAIPIETYLIAGLVSVFSAGSVLGIKKSL